MSQSPAPERPWWWVLGVALSVALVIFGLTAVGYIALIIIGLNNYGSNK
jgi:hypothetical protein